MKFSRETLGFLFLLTLGLGSRLAVITYFPSIPVSDFHNLIAFGLQLRDGGLLSHVPWFWEGFNVGLPLTLCVLFKLFPGHDPDALARLATAVINGLIPLLPFFLWRGVLSMRLRLLAGAALAIWPGQVFFTGVVAQDNWVIFPSIALAVLAVRALADPQRAMPVTAGLMYTAATAMRSDMLLLLPLVLAAARVDRIRIQWRTAVAGCLAAGLGLCGLASFRYAAHGRFSLATQFGGLAILGSYLPGASSAGWIAPYAYLAQVRPDLLKDRQALLAQTAAIGVHVALQRPGFHALRIVSMMAVYSTDGEYSNLFSSIEGAHVLPPAAHVRGAALAAWLKQPLRLEMGLIQGLFLAAVLLGLWRRNYTILVLAAAILMKLVFHAFGVYQGRYFLAATALEILTIAVAFEEALRPQTRVLLPRALAAGAALTLSLFLLAPRLMAYVQARDFDTGQHSFHFSLLPPDQKAELDCTVNQGLLASLDMGISAMLRTLQPFDPAPGDKAVAECVLTGSGAPRPLALQVLDPYDPGDRGGRMVQRVELDGEEVFRQDIGAEPGGGWANIPLGNVGAETRRRVVVEVEALHPEPGQGWAYNSRTSFQLARPSTVMHMAVGRPTSQSSTLTGATASSVAAVDGKLDGNFYNGSVTHTNREPNAWWQVDLGAPRETGSIVIWNRTDCCASRLSDYWVFLSDQPFHHGDTPATLQKRAGIWKSHQTVAPDPSMSVETGGARGRYLRVQLSGTDYLSLAEVQVLGPTVSGHSRKDPSRPRQFPSDTSERNAEAH